MAILLNEVYKRIGYHHESVNGEEGHMFISSLSERFLCRDEGNERFAYDH